MRFCLKIISRRTAATTLFWNYRLISRSLASNEISIRLFEGADHAKLYAKYRPTYPNEVYNELKKYCDHPEASGCDKAVDVGCGNGQSTVPLTSIFKSVFGRDISEKQITEAKKQGHGINYSVGVAEDLSFFENDSVDLVTIAQALHWMDRPRFYEEVRRILRPGGALVVYGYGNCTLDKEEAQHTVWQFYKHTLDGYWSKERRHIDDCLATIELPFKGWSRLDTLSINRTWDVDSLVGYLSSWSAWQTFQKSHPNSSALEDIRNKLKTIYKDEDADEVTSIRITWPIYMMFGRKPKNLQTS